MATFTMIMTLVRYWRQLLAVVVFVCATVIFASIRFAADKDAEVLEFVPRDVSGPMVISAPESLTAGQPLQIVVDKISGRSAILTLNVSYGVQVFEEIASDTGQAIFNLDGQLTQISGYVDLQVNDGLRSASSTMTIWPDRPVEPLTPLVGARSIVADGEHWAMIVVVPFDQYGNPVATGTEVEMRANHPGNWLEEDMVLTENLLAWKRVWSGTVAGRTQIAVESEGMRGPEKDLLEIAGWPIPFDLMADIEGVPADGRRLVKVRSETIVDKHGNEMPDGTLITFLIEDEYGTVRQLPGYTIDGVVEIPIQAPIEPGVLTVYGTVFGIQSRPIEIDFAAGPAVAQFSMQAVVSESTGDVTITAGPLLGELNQYIPDGTTVYFTLLAPNGAERTVTGISDAGYASVSERLSSLPSGVYIVNGRAGSGVGKVNFTIE